MELKGEPGHTSDPLLRPALRRRAHRVLVAHNPVADGDDPSTSDVLAQVELVEAALAGLAVPARRLPVTNWRIWEDLAAAASPRDLATGTVVFNLVEAPPGQPALHPATAGALELLGLPFSGSSAAALWLTTDKLATRAILAASGLPVAPGGRLDRGNAEVLERVPPPWILKPSCEDASLGLDGDAVCATRAAACARAAELEQRFPGQPILVERYLSGRELNISLLANGGQPLVLPVAEIAFLDFPPGMPRIVGYEAKWQPDSFAYTHTVRRFPSDPASAAVIEQASRLALAAWSACGLEGYARVDIRLDEHGAPHILEVNANPCLAADAGFMAAATQAGLTPRAVVASILAAALERHRAAATPRSAAPAAAIATVAKSDDAFAESARRKPAQVRAMA